MTPEYIAGLFDGEGCISISCTRERFYNLRVTISNTHQQIVNMLQVDWSGSVQPYGPRHNARPYSTWLLSGRRAAAFLRVIEPYSIIKKTQIALALQFMQTFDQAACRRRPLLAGTLETRARYKKLLHQAKREGGWR